MVLVAVVPSPKSRLISLIAEVAIPLIVVVNLMGVLVGVVSVAGVSDAHTVRCVVLVTPMMICAADTSVVPRYPFAVIEYVPGRRGVKRYC